MAAPAKKTAKKIKPVQSAQTSAKVLGVFEGECADADITNQNGLDITRPVWENTFSSADYLTAIENGWYIGYLGHPVDPNCMDFKEGCIVMTEGSIDNSGKVQGKFNLIDTPVGRIVKSFIDAGVKFGISVRGAGDIENNSVDPDTFVFRGFDLVSFPAYPDAVPTFTEIAASTDATARAKYKKVCAAVKSNLASINSCEAVDVLQEQFAPQSEEYAMLERRRDEIEQSETINIDSDKVLAMTDLYVEALSQNAILAAENAELKKSGAKVSITANKRLEKIKRIAGAQIHDVVSDREELLKENKRLRSQVTASQNSNLIYRQEIDNRTKTLERKNAILSSLQSDYTETVNAVSEWEARASNLGERNDGLKNEIRAAKNLLRAYQKAYINIYANALGVDPSQIVPTIETSVEELQDQIAGASSSPMSDVFLEPKFVDIEDDYEGDIVTM